MTTLLERSLRRPVGKPQAGTATGLPQVNLLPPEVRAARSLVVVKRWLGIALIAVLVVIACAYGVASLVRQNAESDLASAQAETTRLQQQQNKYAEVPRVLNQVDSTDKARQAGMADEVLWKTYLDAITAVLPDGVSIDSFTLSGPSPLTSVSTSANPLAKPAVGSISFEGRSPKLPDAAAWSDALAKIPGFTDPWISTAAVTANESNDGSYYAISATVQVTDAALAKRFVAKTEGKN